MTKSDDKRVPVLRFKGFTDDWEQRKLGEHIIVSKQKNKDNLSLPAFSISNKNGFIPQEEQFGKDNTYSKTDKSSNYIVKPKYFAYNPARINVGSIAYQNTITPVLVSSLYEIFRSDNNIDDVFLQYWFRSEYFYKQIQRLQEGGVRQYFFIDKMRESQIYLTNVSEQNKIGSLISKLDKLLTLQQRKLNDLKLIRKAVSQTIFPGNNKTESKILVDKTKEVWKKEKAKNIFKEIDIRKVPNNIILSTTQDGRVVTRESLGRNLLFSQDKLKNYKLVKSGQFIIHLRSFKGGFATSNLVGIVSPTYTIFDFKDKDENDSHFWSILFTRYNFIQSLKSVTEGIRYNGVAIKFSQFADLKITYPTLKTQLKISNLFRSLNNDIEKQEFKITKLQELKQFLLQNMFI